MKIKELKERLSKYDDFKEVYFEQDNGSEINISEIEVVSPDELSINQYLLLK